jgi:DNA-binding LytR/AlgR family response regulator
MNISVVIVEDNAITARDLSEILEARDMTVLGIFYSGEEAIERIPQLSPDILLVDIHLKGPMTGLELVNKLNGQCQAPVLYLTANSDKDTIQKALSTRPSSYIIKPFEEENLLVAIELAFSNHNEKLIKEKWDSLPYIFVKHGSRFKKLNFEDIKYLEADGSYCKITTADKEYTLSGNLNHFSEQLDHNFLRIHRSYMVNVGSITSLDADYIFIEDKSFPVGRSYKTQVKKLLRRFS